MRRCAGSPESYATSGRGPTPNTLSCVSFARPGVVSAHIYGHAVDVSAPGGLPIGGNQGLGSVTKTAVERILRLPAELQARQVISLLGFGGPSFALGNHFDQIHIGY